MSVLIVLMAAVSVVGVGMALVSGNRAKPIRPGFDAARIAVGAIGIYLMANLTGVATPTLLAVAAIGVALVVGHGIGRRMAVELRDGRPVGRMSPLGVTVWGLAIVGMQVAALGSRVQVFRVGQAMAYFGVALIVGIVVGRSQPIRAVRSGRPAGVVAAALAMVVGVSLALAYAPAAAGGAPALDDPAAACHVMPSEYRQVLIPEPVPPAFVGCRAFLPDHRPVIQLALYLDASDPLRLFQQGSRLPDTSYQPIDIGDGGELSHGPYDVHVAFVRGPYFVVVTDTSSDRVQGTVIGLAELMDDRIVAYLQEVGFLEAETSRPADPGAAPSPPGQPSDPTTAPSDSGAGSDPDSVTADDLFPVPSSGDGWLDGGEITEGEALVSALAGVLAALAMGAIGFAEAGMQLQDLLRRSGRDEVSGELLEAMRRSGVVDPDLADDGAGGFEPLEPTADGSRADGVAEAEVPGVGAEVPVEGGFEPLEPTEAAHLPAVGEAGEATRPAPVVAGAGQFEPLDADGDDGAAAPVADADVRLSDQEILDAVLSARRGGWSGDELQRYVDGLNESRGGSGTVAIPDLYPVTLEGGTTVVRSGADVVLYESARRSLAEWERYDASVMETYSRLLAEKQKWVGLQQMPGLRLAGAIDQMFEEAAMFDMRLREVDLKIWVAENRSPYALHPPPDISLSEEARRWVARSDLPDLYQQRIQIIIEKQERMQELLGVQVGGEIRHISTDPGRASMLNRPSLKIDELDERLDRILEERRSIRAEKDLLQRTIEEFERPDDW